MSISVKSISLTINGTQSEQFKIEIDGAKYRIDNFTLRQQLLAPAQLSFSLRKDPEEDISEIQFTACSTIIGKEVTLALQTGNMEEKMSGFSDKGQAADVEFEGFITSASAGRSDSEYIIHVNALSKDAAMLDSPDCRMYHEYKLADIVNEVIDRSKVSANVDTKHTDQIFYTVQYNESSYQFLQRMACRYGEWMFSTGKKLHFGKLSDQESVQLKYPSQDLPEYSISLQTFHQNFGQMSFVYNEPDKFNTWENCKEDKDVGNKLNDAVAAASKEIFPHHTRKLTSGGSIEKDSDAEPDGDSIDKMMHKEEMIMQERLRRSNMLVYQGTSYCSKLKIGAKLTIMDNYISSSTEKSEVQQDEILITDITHTFGVNATYSNTFQGITAAIDYPPYTNPNIFPRCDHPVRAFVTDTEDPKHWGRVRVCFLWQQANYDRGDKCGQSPWIQVAQPYSGENGLGMHFIPEVYSQVMVDFEEGNYERPFVVCTQHRQTWSVDEAWYPGNNNVKALRTASGHTIEIHDTQTDDKYGDSGFIRVYDREQNVYEMMLSTDKKLIKLNCKGDINIHADGNISMSAGGNINASAGENINTDAGGSIRNKAGEHVSNSAGGDFNAGAGGTFNGSAGGEVILNAGSNFTAKATAKMDLTSEDEMKIHSAASLGMDTSDEMCISAEKDMSILAHKGLIVTVEEDANVTMTSNLNLTVMKSLETKVTFDYNVKATNITENGDMTFKQYSTNYEVNATAKASVSATAAISLVAPIIKEN